MRLPLSLGPESLHVPHTWRHSVGRVITDDLFPNKGKMDCAVDVCLVMGRLMRLGLTNCDQLPQFDTRGLPQMTRVYRAAIARPWHIGTRF